MAKTKNYDVVDYLRTEKDIDEYLKDIPLLKPSRRSPTRWVIK